MATLAATSYSTSRLSADGCLGADELGAGLAAGRIRAALRAWFARPRRRLALLALDDRTLADIGLDSMRVTTETYTPFGRR
jgi:uncharacterized protein YjiS (DUF1127 family)